MPKNKQSASFKSDGYVVVKCNIKCRSLGKMVEIDVLRRPQCTREFAPVAAGAIEACWTGCEWGGPNVSAEDSARVATISSTLWLCESFFAVD